MSHILPIRVYLPDTDAVGIVYHGTYARFADMARTDWLRDLGWPISRFRDEFGLAPVVQRMEIDYKRPAHVDDLLEVRSSLEDMSAVRTTIRQEIWRGETLCVIVRIVLVFITTEGRPQRMPHDFVRLFHTAKSD